ncbi:MAG TPA: hypothetical protein VKU41_22680 [Polyangiaceae bacterium]|nr:hypothetical protein [Polyangiaceae bacterium]
MKRVSGTLPTAVLVATLAATAVPATALGQLPAPSSGPVTLVLDLAPGGPVDAERLREGIARELGVPIVWQRNAGGGTIAVRQEGPRVVVSFDGPDGRHDGRSIALADSAQAERDITLLAGNVARDQAAQFAPPPSEPTPAPPPAAPPPPPHAPCDAPGPRLAVGADVVPGVGVSTVDGGRSTRSLSVGVLGSLSGGVKGLAVSGLVDIDRGPLCGLQVSGVVNIADDSSGLQSAGIVNKADRLTGVQMAGVFNDSRGDSTGVQIATLNVAGGYLHGVQIGVLNYAYDADLQLGLININPSGRFSLDAWANAEMGLFLAGVKHGGAHYHWLYGVGDRPADASRPWAALGVGAHLTPSQRLYVDLDLIDELEIVFRPSAPVTDVHQARVVVGYELFPRVRVFAGPTYSVLVAAPSAPAGAPAYAADLADSSSIVVRGWPGVAVGVEGL